MTEEPILNPGKSESTSAQPENQSTQTPPSVTGPKADIPGSIEDKHRPKQTQENIREWWKTGVETLTLLAVLWYACIASRQLTQMRRATQAAGESADATYAQIRPWIKIDGVELRSGLGPIKTLSFHWPLGGKPTPPMLQVKVTVSNVGHTVAEGVKVYPELFFGQFNPNTWHDVVTGEESKFCNSERDQKPIGGDVATVFPSESRDWYMAVGGLLPKAQRPASALIFCVNYVGISPTHNSQTQAWFGLYENNAVFIQGEVDVNAASLRLIRDESGDHAY